MSSKRNLVVAMAFLVALTASFAAAQNKTAKKATDTAEEKAPRLTIVEPVKEYGEVAKGDKLDWSFVIKNTGNADLQIIAARPGCGCTVADFDKVVKPGETGKVTAHVDTTAFSGPIAKTVTLETNDPASPSSTLTIHAVVKPYVEAYPAGFVRFNQLQGDVNTQSLTIYSEDEEPFEIRDVQVPVDPATGKPVDWIKVSTHKLEDADKVASIGRPGQNQYRVDITVGGPDAKIGPMADKIRLVTNSKHQPEYMVSVSGVIRPTYRVEPTALNFGEVAPTEAAATRSVLVHSNDLKTPETFVVTKVESDVPEITTAFKPLAQKGDYEVTLQVSKNAKPGDIDGTVKIYTTDKVNPVVTLPVKGTIKTPVVAPTASKSSK
ncbi:MAG TPA: DUF1573 domain-containing protein [Thermoanaerobaculia bacterium]|nr:DUF1573 domain-containing protein [Thermoanaerobaculia bacterium]